jgi:phosphoribosyl 1,2-cyclic phosphodiesterase
MKVIVLGSGSLGNATLIETASCNILIDAGLTYKNISERLGYNPVIDIVIITHTHKDHISGLKSVLKKKPIVYTMSELCDKVSYDKINNEREFACGDVSVSLFELSHDSSCSGVSITDGKMELVYITDTGYINKSVLKKISNKDFYIVESNHDVDMLRHSSKPFYLQKRILGDKGHLSNEQTLNYLKGIVGSRTKGVILAHLSLENNDSDLVYKMMCEGLRDKNIQKILVAKQHEALDEVVIND